ncbi:rho GTPase-activating protein 22 isoform X3 [Xenopus laevis]|uniref:Rho GTPase-activating protein 22 isoform X3 n=1 Tax=Xenopus laevis TaxID=8355 RepID=A0A8J1L8W9_XENLA|nr:rho GTPase-activating protein 22 isoform X3 [Xenopus laevis]
MGENRGPNPVQTLFPIQKVQTLKSGWLKKRRNIMKNWQHRWFVLRGQELRYYKDKEEGKLQGCIPLLGFQVLEVNSQSEETNRYLFEIVPAVFGQRLEEAVNLETSHAPLVVEQCVDFIRENGLQEEGLFRLPGQATLVKELQDAFDSGAKPTFDKNTDVHTVASLLKLYLRELPEPVIPFSRYQDFLRCAHTLSRDQEEGTQEICILIKGLPPVNYNLLKYICSFLDEVQSHSDTNKMSVQNLATVFAPNILRPKLQDPIALIEGASLIQHLMTILIRENQRIFQAVSSDSPARESVQQIDTTQCIQDAGTAKFQSLEPILYGNHEQTRAKSQIFANWKASFMLSSSKSVFSSCDSSNQPPSGSWLQNGFSSLRSQREKDSAKAQRLSSYDNVPSCLPSLPSSNWSSFSNVSLNDSLASCQACDGSQVSQGSGSAWHLSLSESERRTLPLASSIERLELCVSSSGQSDTTLTSDSGEVWNTCHRMVTELKEQLAKQQVEYENKMTSLERSRAEVLVQVRSLQDKLEQEKNRCTLLEIKLRNSERGREDAEFRNTVLQKEMEEFFQTLGNLSQNRTSKYPNKDYI